jgi:hypothetical protein
MSDQVFNCQKVREITFYSDDPVLQNRIHGEVISIKDNLTLLMNFEINENLDRERDIMGKEVTIDFGDILMDITLTFGSEISATVEELAGVRGRYRVKIFST